MLATYTHTAAQNKIHPIQTQIYQKIVKHVLSSGRFTQQCFAFRAYTTSDLSCFCGDVFAAIQWQHKVRSTMPEKNTGNIDGQKAEKLCRWPKAKCEWIHSLQMEAPAGCAFYVWTRPERLPCTSSWPSLGLGKEGTKLVTDEGRALTPSGRIKRPCAWKITEWLSTEWHSLPHDTIVRVFKKCLISNDFNGARVTSSRKTAVKHSTSDDADNNDERRGNYSSETGQCLPPSL